MTKPPQNQNLFEALKQILMSRKASTQEDLCHALEKLGYEINQSKVSRILRKMGAIKIQGAQGQIVYSLPREPSPPTPATPLRELILDVTSNETLVIIFTSPGSASMVARILDYHQDSFGILGTLAGDDTIFVAPISIKETVSLAQKIRTLFFS